MDGVDAKASLGIHDQRYRLDHKIGEGGMAVVWRAFDLNLKAPRAIKIVRGGGRATSLRVRRLTAEGRALTRLDSIRHPNLVRVYEFNEFEDPASKETRAFIVMEYVEGGTVEEQLQAAAVIPPRRAVRWMVQVLSALGAAHRAGVVHRDIKPSNILLDRDGNAVLADFGIAMLLDDDDRFTRTGVMMGSVAFAAPEQRLSARQARPTSDLYAAGATLYQMLTGMPPDHLFADTADEPRWQVVDEPLRSVLIKAMKKDPADRYQTADDMADALEACVPALPPDAAADALARFPADPGDSRDGAMPTFGQTQTDDGVPPDPERARPVAEGARVRRGGLAWVAGVVAVTAVSLAVRGAWTGSDGPVVAAPSSAPQAIEVQSVAVPPPVPAAPPPPVEAAQPPPAIDRPRDAATPTRKVRPAEAPDPVAPDMAPLAGRWHRLVGTLGPSELVLGGTTEALRGTWSVSRAGLRLSAGALDQGRWDPQTGDGVVEYVQGEDGPVIRLDLHVAPDGTLLARCCGAAVQSQGDLKYRRAR